MQIICNNCWIYFEKSIGRHEISHSNLLRGNLLTLNFFQLSNINSSTFMSNCRSKVQRFQQKNSNWPGEPSDWSFSFYSENSMWHAAYNVGETLIKLKCLREKSDVLENWLTIDLKKRGRRVWFKFGWVLVCSSSHSA